LQITLCKTVVKSRDKNCNVTVQFSIVNKI